MFYYKDYLTLNSKFSKSTNIVHDSEDCENYILTTSAQNVLKVLFKRDYHNSISLIGPFGCGKSSLLLYINTLLSDNEYSTKCIGKLKENNNDLFLEYGEFRDSRKFLRIKIIGEHTSFKTQFKNVLLNHKELKTTNKYLKEDNEFLLSKALEYLNSDLNKSIYSDILFSIDEFGKFIEYGLEDINSNDIFDLQTLSEFVNKKNNIKLIVSLHKSFNEYTLDSASISYSDWDKIQGRFENIIFKDDYYEMLNIFKETISLKESNHLSESKNLVKKICEDENLKKSINFTEVEKLFENIIPLHPYAVLIIVEIFTKYFQNQRSIYSFIFSSEPAAFQEFIYKKLEKKELYTLSNLYDYVSYLLRVYSIILPDREIWYFSEERLKDPRITNIVQKDIIKTISLIHTFKLSSTVIPNDAHIILSLMDKYSELEIIKNIEKLKELNLLTFQEQTLSYSLLEDSNIDINKELKNIISKDINIDYEAKIDQIIKNKYLVAKRFFSEYGNKKVFEKKYVSNSKKLLDSGYKILLIDNRDFDVKSISKKNKKSVFVILKNTKKINELVEKTEALNIMKDENKEKISLKTNDIIESMILDYSISLDKILYESCLNSRVYFKGNEYIYNSKVIQRLLTEISEESYPDTPILNNYTLNHTISNKTTNTTIVKGLFRKLLGEFDKKDLDFAKFPPEKALYLSIVKPAGIHRKIDDEYKLCEPNNLNFKNIWNFISKVLSKKIKVIEILNILEQEPFGLNKASALFILSLYIIVNKDKINIFRDNTYTYDLPVDLLINIWKASERYEVELVTLTKEQERLFEGYIKIATKLSDFSFSKEKITAITKTLFGKFRQLPEYAMTTRKLSKEAINLRSSLLSMKEPTESFFSKFPKDLGYDSIKNIDVLEYEVKFKNAFNEIALSYVQEVTSLEKYIAEVFHLDSNSFPYNNSLIKLSKKLEKLDGLNSNIKAMLGAFTYSNTTIELIDKLTVILMRKKLEECTDKDIDIFKDIFLQYSEQILSKLELSDIATENHDVRKVSLASLDSNLNKVISIDKKKMDKIQEEVLRIKKIIPSSYTNDEKLYLISQLLNEELKNE